MPVSVLMPALSPTMEEGTLAKWMVSEGDTIEAGDVIAEIETDKATMEVEAVEEGTLAKILVEEGTEEVKVNAPIAIILEEGEDESALEGFDPSEGAPPPPSSSADDDDEDDDDDTSSDEGDDGADADSEKVPAQPKAQEPEDDPEIPEGTEMETLTVREALRDAMAEEMRRDDTVFVMGEEVAEYEGAYKVTQGLLDEFGAKRVVDTPITEHGFAGLGVGAAFAGLRPVVEFMTFNFAMQAIDQIVNSAAKTLYMSGGQMGCPMVFRGPNGAASRVGAQHSQDYSSWYAQIPGLKVVSPYSAADAKGLLKAAIRDPNPVIFLENEILYGKSFEVPKLDDFVLPIGKARIVKPGKDVTLIAHSISVGYCLEAAEKLKKDGLDAEVIDLRSLRPIDWETLITSLKKTNRAVTVEEGFPVCGIGAEIAAELSARAFDYLDAPILRVAGKDVPMPYAANLEKLALPSIDEVVEAARKVSYVEGK